MIKINCIFLLFSFIILRDGFIGFILKKEVIKNTNNVYLNNLVIFIIYLLFNAYLLIVIISFKSLLLASKFIICII